jgi:predicted transcriptional regulator of viral defense system
MPPQAKKPRKSRAKVPPVVSYYPTRARYAVEGLVIDALRQQEQATHADLRRAIFCAPATLRKTLARMLAEGLLARPAPGIYRLAP